MNTIYIECPHCDDELEFKIEHECDGVVRVGLLEQNCDCKISDVSMNELENLAIEKTSDF